MELLPAECCAFPLQSAEAEPRGEDRNAPGLGFFTCLSVEYYQRFFDVSTMEVREGMLFSIQLDTVFSILGSDCTVVWFLHLMSSLIYNGRLRIMAEYLCTTLVHFMCMPHIIFTYTTPALSHVFCRDNDKLKVCSCEVDRQQFEYFTVCVGLLPASVVSHECRCWIEYFGQWCHTRGPSVKLLKNVQMFMVRMAEGLLECWVQITAVG